MNRPDEQLTRALYAQHAAVVFPHALAAAGGDRARAQELLRRALLGAVRRPAVVAGGDVGGWLISEVRRQAAGTAGSWWGLLRRRGTAEPPGAGPDGSPDAGAEPAAAERGPAVARALATLPAEHRAVLVESYLKGRTVQQAAAVLDLPPQVVKSRIYYGLHRLALALEEQESAR